MKIGISVSKRTIVEKKKGANRSGIGTNITKTTHSLSIAGSRTSSYLLVEIALSAMVMIGMTGPIDAITMMIGGLMGRSGGERQFMID